jgi:dihydrolipoamide dehydrogenase
VRSEPFDCVVIGAGPGGYVAAIRAAQLGMTTAVVEKGAVGGRCLNYACIPAKVVLRAADILEEVRDAHAFGISAGEPTIDFGSVQARRANVVKTLTGGVGGLLKKNGIAYIEGSGSVTAGGDLKVVGRASVDDGPVSVDEFHAARCVILATGSVRKPIPGIEFGGRVIGTEEAWALSSLPRSVVVLGAGASGSEVASAYARLGSKVVLVEALERVLPSEDPDISSLVERGFRAQGIDVRTSTFTENVQTADDKVTFSLQGEAGEAEWLVVAAGRGPDVAGLGLDEAGIRLEAGGLVAVAPRFARALRRCMRSGIWSPVPRWLTRRRRRG